MEQTHAYRRCDTFSFVARALKITTMIPLFRVRAYEPIRTSIRRKYLHTKATPSVRNFFVSKNHKTSWSPAFLALFGLGAGLLGSKAEQNPEGPEETLFSFEAEDTEGKLVPLQQFQGKVCIVVNVATNTPYAEPNYRQLQYLYEKYHDQGLEILAFPASQFRDTEPGSAPEIKQFVQETYKITFPIFGVVKQVNPGPDCHPIFYYCRHQLPGKAWYGSWKIPWCWTKFLFDHNGKGVKRCDPSSLPLNLEPEIQRLLEIRNGKASREKTPK